MTLRPLTAPEGPFRWRGTVPVSKSMAIRHLVIRDYAEEGTYSTGSHSDADDVHHAEAALRALSVGEVANCGEGGAVLRFLALRASRMTGVHRLTGGERLFQRPLRPLLQLLEALGARATMDNNTLVLESDSRWHLENSVSVDDRISSQFASGVLLNAWGLEEPLRLGVTASAVSEPYRTMTVAMLRDCGMEIEQQSDGSGVGLVVQPGQVVRGGTYATESDASCAFVLAAAGAVSGTVTVDRFSHQSLQPDSCFPDLLERMGARVTREADTVTVERAGTLAATQVDLGDAPDLFCVLSVCAGVAEGRSQLRGAPHLRHKESDRIARTAELMRGLGRTVWEHDDGIDVLGRPHDFTDAEPFAFDAGADHRLAMAAGVAVLAGARIALTNHHVVSKSFPQFWQTVGISL